MLQEQRHSVEGGSIIWILFLQALRERDISTNLGYWKPIISIEFSSTLALLLVSKQ